MLISETSLVFTYKPSESEIGEMLFSALLGVQY